MKQDQTSSWMRWWHHTSRFNIDNCTILKATNDFSFPHIHSHKENFKDNNSGVCVWVWIPSTRWFASKKIEGCPNPNTSRTYHQSRPPTMKMQTSFNPTKMRLFANHSWQMVQWDLRDCATTRRVVVTEARRTAWANMVCVECFGLFFVGMHTELEHCTKCLIKSFEKSNLVSLFVFDTSQQWRKAS